MATVKLVEYQEADPKAKAVFDDLKEIRQTDFINNFWKAMANQPSNMHRIWEQIKEVMQPGALDALTKELIYIAVSVANNCEYCIHSHTASAFNKGMSKEQYEELMAVILMAQQTNSLASALQVPVDSEFQQHIEEKE